MGRSPGRGGAPGVSWEQGQRRRLHAGLGSRKSDVRGDMRLGVEPVRLVEGGAGLDWIGPVE